MKTAAAVMLVVFVALIVYDASRSYCAVCRRQWAIFPAPSTLDPTKRCWRCWRERVV